MLKAFKERTGRFPVRKDSLEDESIHQLYTWCSSQRQFYKTGRMLQDRILKLQEMGFELSVLSDAERWDEKYTQLVEICEMLNHFPSGNEVENKKLMSWMIIQRKLIKDGTLSDVSISYGDLSPNSYFSIYNHH